MRRKEDSSVLIVGIVVLVLVIIFLFEGLGNFDRMMGGFGFMWLFGLLFMVLILIALVLFIVWLINQLVPRQTIRKKR